MPTQTGTPERVVKFFLEEGHGSDTGIYSSEEVLKLPKRARQNVQTLSSALTKGKINANMASADNINDFDFYSPTNKKTGKPKHKSMRGAEEGVWDSTTQKSKAYIKPSNKKLGNKLRDKLKDIKQSTEKSSIKAKIAAKKAGNGAQSHPSDAGH